MLNIIRAKIKKLLSITEPDDPEFSHTDEKITKSLHYQ